MNIYQHNFNRRSHTGLPLCYPDGVFTRSLFLCLLLKDGKMLFLFVRMQDVVSSLFVCQDGRHGIFIVCQDTGYGIFFCQDRLQDMVSF